MQLHTILKETMQSLTALVRYYKEIQKITRTRQVVFP